MADYTLILRSSPNDQAFFSKVNDTIESLVMIVKSVFLYDHSERRSETVTEHYWRERVKDGATVALVDDEEMPARYLYVAGPDAKQCERIFKNLKYLLPVVPVEELREQARSPEQDPGVLPRLALALNDAFDAESFEVLARGLEHERLEVRMAAATAAIVLKWKRFVPHLEAALAREKTEEGRQVLSHVLQVCRTSGKESKGTP